VREIFFAGRFRFGNEVEIVAEILQALDLNPNPSKFRRVRHPREIQSCRGRTLVPRPRVGHPPNQELRSFSSPKAVLVSEAGLTLVRQQPIRGENSCF
jgi:hypothetical protein